MFLILFLWLVICKSYTCTRICNNSTFMLKVPSCKISTFQASYFNQIVPLWNTVCFGLYSIFIIIEINFWRGYDLCIVFIPWLSLSLGLISQLTFSLFLVYLNFNGSGRLAWVFDSRLCPPRFGNLLMYILCRIPDNVFHHLYCFLMVCEKITQLCMLVVFVLCQWKLSCIYCFIRTLLALFDPE